MLHLNVRIVLFCLAPLLLVIACADTQKKTTTAEPAAETVEANVEEVTLAVTGMT